MHTNGCPAGRAGHRNRNLSPGRLRWGVAGVQCVVRKVLRPVAIARAARACHRGDAISVASVVLRMLAHSMNTLGMVDRLVPARSLRGWIPLIPS